MKIHLSILGYILMLCIASTAFAQKCKEKYPDVIVSKGGGPGINAGGPRIKDKPQPEYTEEARRHEISGTVLLRAVFHSSGKVRDVCWVSSLPYGLTENAIKAAYQIRFEPLERDGRPLSVAMLVEYNFQLY